MVGIILLMVWIVFLLFVVELTVVLLLILLLIFGRFDALDIFDFTTGSVGWVDIDVTAGTVTLDLMFGVVTEVGIIVGVVVLTEVGNVLVVVKVVGLAIVLDG